MLCLPQASRRPVLVLGASGYIGSHLVPALIARGDPVRAVARARGVLEAPGGIGVEIVEADALAPDSLPDALTGTDTACYLVQSMAAAQHFGELDFTAAAYPSPRTAPA